MAKECNFELRGICGSSNFEILQTPGRGTPTGQNHHTIHTLRGRFLGILP